MKNILPLSITAVIPIFVKEFERPAEQGQSVQDKRASYGQVYYDKFAGTKGVEAVMSNSSLVSYTKLSPNHSGKRNHAIDTISIHCMAGNLSVESCGNMFAEKSRKASSNYGIGSDGRIALYVDEANRSWCTSSSSNDNRAITIEVANSEIGEPWPITDAAYNALIDLLVDICQRNGISKLLWRGDKSLIGQVDKQNMTVHRRFAAKSCPGNWLYEHHDQIANDVNKRLGQEDDEDMTLDKFKELMKEYRTELQDNDCGTRSQEGRDFCINNGIFVGAGTDENGQPNYMYGDFVTREQLMVVIKRLFEMLDK